MTQLRPRLGLYDLGDLGLITNGDVFDVLSLLSVVIKIFKGLDEESGGMIETLHNEH